MTTKENFPDVPLVADKCLLAEKQHEVCERAIFGLALTLAVEPSRLLQLRQMLAQLQKLQVLPQGFLTWACERIDERVMLMVPEYAYEAEGLLQILSFKGGSFASLLQDVEDLYRQEKISQRVYVNAKLLLRNAPQPE